MLDYTASDKDSLEVHLPRKISPAHSLNEILAFARRENASDVHLSPQNPIVFRKAGRLTPVTSDALSAPHIHNILIKALPPKIMEAFEKSGDVEYVHAISGYGYFRLTLMKQRKGKELTTRLIPLEIPRFAATGMPTSCASLIKWSHGIILITGPAGCGKTTTLATLVEMINQRRSDHIVIIEDPIETIYEPNLCQITQRQIGTHTLSQVRALRAALREDPDVIVVGELRELSTVELAITAAETGHLVLATMNTVNAAQTISRLIDFYPTENQQMIRNLISESLRGIICQQLVPKKDGSGMAAAFEVLMNTPSVANYIRKGAINQIENTIAMGKSFGMVRMQDSLQSLVDKDMISMEEVRQRHQQLNEEKND